MENNPREEISKIILELNYMLREVKASFDVFVYISDIAGLKKMTPRDEDFWAFIQKLSLDNIVLYLSIIWGREKAVGCIQNSIERILKIIEENKLSIFKNSDETIRFFLINNFIKKEEIADEDLVAKFCSMVRFFKKENQRVLEMLKTTRDSRVAHSDRNTLITKVGPINDIKKIIEVGCDFVEVVSIAFIGLGISNYKKDVSRKRTLESYFKKLNFDN